MRKNADELEERSIELLSRLHESRPNLTHLMLLRSIPVLGSSGVDKATNSVEAPSIVNPTIGKDKGISKKGRTIIELVKRAEARTFSSQTSVQELIDKIWYGQMVGPGSGKSRLLRYILPGIILWPLMIIFCFFDIITFNEARKQIEFDDLKTLV